MGSAIHRETSRRWSLLWSTNRGYESVWIRSIQLPQSQGIATSTCQLSKPSRSSQSGRQWSNHGTAHRSTSTIRFQNSRNEQGNLEMDLWKGRFLLEYRKGMPDGCEERWDGRHDWKLIRLDKAGDNGCKADTTSRTQQPPKNLQKVTLNPSRAIKERAEGWAKWKW